MSVLPTSTSEIEDSDSQSNFSSEKMRPYSPNSRLFFRFTVIIFGTALLSIFFMSFLKGNPTTSPNVAKATSLSKFSQLLFPLSHDDLQTSIEIFNFLSQDNIIDIKERYSFLT